MPSEPARALRQSPAPSGSELRARLAALLAGITDCARELERGAACQPAMEELLLARRLSEGRAMVLVLWSDERALRYFLRSALDVQSREGVALDALPERVLLHMQEAAEPARRVLVLRESTAQLALWSGLPVYARIQVRCNDTTPQSIPGGEQGDALLRIVYHAEGGECGRDAVLESPAGIDFTPCAGAASSFWAAPLFADHGLIDALRLLRALVALSRALESLRRRLALLRQEQLSALALLRGTEPRVATANALRGGKDNALRLASETLSELVNGVRERSRRAASRGAWLWSFQANALNQIGRESIAREERRRVVRLSVNEEQVRAIEASFLRTFKGMLSKELEALRTELDGLCRVLEQQLDSPRGSMSCEFPDDQSVWNDVAGYAALDVRYRGEIPRRGFMERLAEGRKVVFLLLMIGSLAGSFVGFNLRQSGLIGLFCLALFVATIAWSYKSWADEEAELIDRETDKLSDLVESAIVKTTSDALREASNGVIAALESVRKQLLARIEAALTRAKKELEDRQLDEQRDTQLRIQGAEALLKQLAGVEPVLQRQLQLLDALTQDAARVVQAAVRQACSP